MSHTPDIFPITSEEADALHGLDWESGYGWNDQFDWWLTPGMGPRECVEDRPELMQRFLADLDFIRAEAARRESHACLIAAAPDMNEALTECQQVLALMVDPSKRHVSVIHVWAQAVEAEAKARAALAKAQPAPQIGR